MELIKQASGKKTLKISRTEWETIGKKASWMKKAQVDLAPDPLYTDDGFDVVESPEEDALREQRGSEEGLGEDEIDFITDKARSNPLEFKNVLRMNTDILETLSALLENQIPRPSLTDAADDMSEQYWAARK